MGVLENCDDSDGAESAAADDDDDDDEEEEEEEDAVVERQEFIGSSCRGEGTAFGIR
jgi:hypothetical protein